jgi:hypothetical protein
MTLCCFSTRCWLWYEVDRCRDLSKGSFDKYPAYGWDCGLLEKVPLGMEWESGWIGKVPMVWSGLEGISFAESNAQIN